MGKIRFLSAVVAIAMLMPMLTSCKSGKIGKKVVKEDDPWYESTRFELSQDLEQYNCIGGAYELCSSTDKVFYLYCFRKTVGAPVQQSLMLMILMAIWLAVRMYRIRMKSQLLISRQCTRILKGKL